MLGLSKFTSSNKLLYILGGAVFVVVIITVVWFAGRTREAATSATLEFWGVFDDKRVFLDIVKKFQSTSRDIKVNYKQFSYEDYEKGLINALAAGTGPDIIMIQNTWLPRHKDKLTPQPTPTKDNKEGFLSIADLKSQFVDVVYDDLTSGGKIYALPLYVDTLALYYNK